MPNINFPSSPSLNDTYTFNDITYTWDGEKWTAYSNLTAGSPNYSDNQVDIHLNQSNPANGHVLSWTSGDYAWVSNSGGGSSTVAGLSDVDSVDTVATGDVLLYDGSEYGFVNLEGEINTRADSRIATSSIQDLSDVVASGVDTVASGDTLLWDGSNNRFGFINLGSEINSYFDTRLATKNTANLAEGTNLYYTNGRVDAHLNTSTAANSEVLSWTGTDYDWVSNTTLSNIADSAQGVDVTGRVATTGVNISTGGVLNAAGTSVDFGSAIVSFSGASISGLTGEIKDVVEIGVAETFTTTNAASGVTALDCNNGHIFYLTSPSGDVTANFTNSYLNANYATNFTVVVNQGATPYEVTALQLDGSGQTINWQGGSAPTGTANGIDVFSFTILRDSSSYIVLGQMVDFT
jgi:hypothetical protein